MQSLPPRQSDITSSQIFSADKWRDGPFQRHLRPLQSLAAHTSGSQCKQLPIYSSGFCSSPTPERAINLFYPQRRAFVSHRLVDDFTCLLFGAGLVVYCMFITTRWIDGWRRRLAARRSRFDAEGLGGVGTFSQFMCGFSLGLPIFLLQSKNHTKPSTAGMWNASQCECEDAWWVRWKVTVMVWHLSALLLGQVSFLNVVWGDLLYMHKSVIILSFKHMITMWWICVVCVGSQTSNHCLQLYKFPKGKQSFGTFWRNFFFMGIKVLRIKCNSHNLHSILGLDKNPAVQTHPNWWAVKVLVLFEASHPFIIPTMMNYLKASKFYPFAPCWTVSLRRRRPDSQQLDTPAWLDTLRQTGGRPSAGRRWMLFCSWPWPLASLQRRRWSQKQNLPSGLKKTA